MVSLTLDSIVPAWLDSRHQLLSASLLLQQTIVRTLAAGKPISVQRAATATGLSLDIVRSYFAQFKACGAEMDDAGNVTGWILSLNPTSHRLHVNRRVLYAWCALDTLFLPALISQPAEVESICPATGIPLQLTVTPTGVTAIHPGSIVVSVVVPGISAVCKACQNGEVTRTVCYAMHFFSSLEAAVQYLGPSSDVAVLGLEEAWQLVHAVWIEPLTKY